MSIQADVEHRLGSIDVSIRDELIKSPIFERSSFSQSANKDTPFHRISFANFRFFISAADALFIFIIFFEKWDTFVHFDRR